MSTRAFAKNLGLAVGLSWLGAFACSSGDESLGRDRNEAQQSAAGSSGSGETPGGHGQTSDCETVQCFRAVECVETCGGPVVQSSCCPCPPGTLDLLVDCAAGQGGAGDGPGAGGHSGSTGTPSGGEGGYAQGGVGGATGAEPDLTLLHSNCVGDDTCPPGLTPMVYYGVAGPPEPRFCTCEIPCEKSPDDCPPPTTCAVISDGPGAVCTQ